MKQNTWIGEASIWDRLVTASPAGAKLQDMDMDHLGNLAVLEKKLPCRRVLAMPSLCGMALGTAEML